MANPKRWGGGKGGGGGGGLVGFWGICFGFPETGLVTDYPNQWWTQPLIKADVPIHSILRAVTGGFHVTRDSTVFFLFFRWFDLNFRRFCFRCFLRFLPALPVFFLFTGTTFTWIWTLQTRSTECYSSIHKFQIIYISFSVAYFFMYFYWVSPFYSHLFQLKKNPGLTWYWFGKIIFGRYKSLGNISRVGCSNCPSCVICSRLHLSDSSWSIEIKLLFVRNTL